MVVGVITIILVFAGSTLLAEKLGAQIRTAMRSQAEVLTSVERLKHYGSVLELSIESAASTGDPKAAARFRAVQPKLRQSINRLRADLDLSSSSDIAARVDAADLELLALKFQALELAARGRLKDASRVIGSGRYEQLRKAYIEGLDEIEAHARAHLRASEQEVEWYFSAMLALRSVSFGLLLVAWVAVARRARRWATQLHDARERAQCALEELTKAQAQLERANDKLFLQARVDPLTGLSSRLKFNEDIVQILPRVSGHGESFTLVMCDVDRFKQYNDTYGHPAGDEALRAIADAFAGVGRAGDGIYRYGGEEFVLVLRTASLEAGIVCAERYRAAVEAMQIPHSGSAMGVVTVSMGAAQIGPGRIWSVESWLERADGALYEAKQAGRNRVVSAGALPRNESARAHLPHLVQWALRVAGQKRSTAAALHGSNGEAEPICSTPS